MTDSSDVTLGLLSKSSPSQLGAFHFNRSRSQPATDGFYVSSPKLVMNGNNNSSSSLKPSNLSHVPCKFYKQGTCTAGANCTFSHSSDLSSESAVCKYFVKGNCKFGTKCALLHTMSPYSNIKAPSLSYTGRRKTTSDDHRSFLNDPFATSAPLFGGDQLWRNHHSPRTNMIGVRSSPRENENSLGTSPYYTSYSYQQPQDQQQNGYDLNDAMLPSSLNDLFTPNELHARSLRQSRDVAQSFETPWRTPPPPTPSFGETAAINIPYGGGGTNSGSSGTSSGSYLQGQQNDDDEFQFFMEDDEAVTFDHMKQTPYTSMPPLISLPSTS